MIVNGLRTASPPGKSLVWSADPRQGELALGARAPLSWEIHGEHGRVEARDLELVVQVLEANADPATAWRGAITYELSQAHGGAVHRLVGVMDPPATDSPQSLPAAGLRRVIGGANEIHLVMRSFVAARVVCSIAPVAFGMLPITSQLLGDFPLLSPIPVGSREVRLLPDRRIPSATAVWVPWYSSTQSVSAWTLTEWSVVPHEARAIVGAQALPDGDGGVVQVSMQVEFR